MAGWLSIEDIPAWNEEQLRYLLKNALRLYRIRGNCRISGGKCLLTLYRDCEVYVVEHYQMQESDPEKIRRWKKLYGDSPYTVTVLIHTGQNGGQKGIQDLHADCETCGSTAHIDCRIVLLTPPHLFWISTRILASTAGLVNIVRCS
ncbi:MAG: hypothetical protein ACLUAR_10385 [Pilosibacter sp.]